MAPKVVNLNPKLLALWSVLKVVKRQMFIKDNEKNHQNLNIFEKQDIYN